MPICCVYKCNNRNGALFPRDENVRQKWIEAIRREEEFVVKSRTTVCWSHFRPEDFMQESYHSGAPLTYKKLKKGVVPSVFFWNKHGSRVRQPSRHRPAPVVRTSDPSPSSNDQEASTHVSFRLIPSEANRSVPSTAADEPKIIAEELICVVTKTTDSICAANSHPGDYDISISNENPESSIEEDVCEVILNETQPLTPITVNKKEIPDAPRLEKRDIHCGTVKKEASTQTKMKWTTFSVENFKNKPAFFSYYTGLESYEKFIFVLGTLGPSVSELIYRDATVVNVSIEDQFLITLIKLRRATPDFELGVMFDVSVKTVGNIFVTWVLFMSRKWVEMDDWPSRDLFSYYMPEVFSNMDPSTRVIIDGAGTPVHEPTPVFQQPSRSTYKNVNPVLGSANDQAIVENSDRLEKCDPNDSIMSNRGFTVKDIFAAKDIATSIPALSKRKSQLPDMTVPADGKLASKQVIGLAKTYKILKYVHLHLHLASHIFCCCAILCKFREGIKSKTA